MNKNQSVISGVVRNPKGKPVADARVYFTDAPVSLPDIAVLTDDKGEFTLSAPAKGIYLLECNANGFATANVTVEAKSGQASQVEIRLKK